MKILKAIAATVITLAMIPSAMAHGSVGVVIGGGGWAISGSYGYPYYGYGYGYPVYPTYRVPYSPYIPYYGLPPQVTMVPPQPVIVQPAAPVYHQPGTQFQWIYDESCKCYIGRYK